MYAEFHAEWSGSHIASYNKEKKLVSLSSFGEDWQVVSEHVSLSS